MRRRSREVDEVVDPDLQRSDRAARNKRLCSNVQEDVPPDEGVISYLYECDQFLDPSGAFDPIRGVKTRHFIRKNEKICRYLGEHIDGVEKTRRAVAGLASKIAYAGYDEDDENNKVFIDGNVGGNIASMINSHCSLDNAILLKESEDFPKEGTAALNVYAKCDIDSDDDVYIKASHFFDDTLPVDSIPTYRCLCKGRNSDGDAICDAIMT